MISDINFSLNLEDFDNELFWEEYRFTGLPNTAQKVRALRHSPKSFAFAQDFFYADTVICHLQVKK